MTTAKIILLENLSLYDYQYCLLWVLRTSIRWSGENSVFLFLDLASNTSLQQLANYWTRVCMVYAVFVSICIYVCVCVCACVQVYK